MARRQFLCGDFNENAYDGRFAVRLQQADIMMTEQCKVATGRQLPATYVTGTRTIDAVYATAGIQVINAALLPKYGGIGDPRDNIWVYITYDRRRAEVYYKTPVIPNTSIFWEQRSIGNLDSRRRVNYI